MYWDIKADIVVITALEKEFDALKVKFRMLNEDKVRELIGIREYYIIDFESADKQSSVKVAFVCAEGMGRVSAALAARDAIYDLTPKYIILVGIAAADPQGGRLQKGDVVIAEGGVDYEIQKITPEEIEPRPYHFTCSGDLVRIAKDVINQRWVEDISDEIREHAPAEYHGARAYIVKVACGDKVIADPKTRDNLLKTLGKPGPPLDVIEMESAGICHAIYQTPDEKAPDFIMIKGICDFADYDKNDQAQKFAAKVAGVFLHRFLSTFLERNKEKYLMGEKRIQIEPRYQPSIYLGPRENALRIFEDYPKKLCHGWRETMIDGAIEILFCPKSKNKYGGFGRNKIICVCQDDKEWPRDADLDDRESRIREFAKGLIGIDENTKGWIKDRRATPNRIRILLNAPVDPVLDRSELFLHFGNSDYFTVRTVTEISRREREGTLGGLKLSDIFPTRWAERGKPFPKNCVPYHVSAQGILVCREPDTHKKYLILALTNPRGSTLVYGWGATMAEQMWAPEPITSFTPWWADFTNNLGIKPEPGEERQGDVHIQDTLIRGLKEEFGLVAGEHYHADPKLLNVCLEEDMYFITFIFFVQVDLPLAKLYEQWVNAPDHREFDLLAAYQIEGQDENGKEIDGPKRIADLLAQDNFDGGRYLIKNPTGSPIVGPWHITSRMRIYVAASHMWGKRILEYVSVK